MPTATLAPSRHHTPFFAPPRPARRAGRSADGPHRLSRHRPAHVVRPASASPVDATKATRPSPFHVLAGTLSTSLLSAFYEATDAVEFYFGTLCVAVAVLLFNWLAVGLLLDMAQAHGYALLALLVGGVGMGGIGVLHLGAQRSLMARQHRRLCELRTVCREAQPVPPRL